MARNRRHEEEPETHERWLVTYADMLTLLMVLFIVMFAMSQVDEAKFNALRAGLAEGFGASSSFMAGSDSFLQDQPEQTSPEVVASMDFRAPTPPDQAVADEAAREGNRLEAIQKHVEEVLRRHGLSQDVRMNIDDRGLVISLVSRHVVFQADVAELSPRGQHVVDVLAPVLRAIPDDLRIDGHTNQVQVRPKYYATDWDLSAARAVTVLRRLNEAGGVPADRLSVAAFGHEMPLVDPDEPGSQQVNKRVDIVVLSPVSEEARALLGTSGRAGSGREGGS
ncbi:flagellar motor protein MotB [Nocardioides aquiterrae]|uniref:Flagellar motor protein MotB n=1 Tax=Nocardioides aquiterrae TaxID=203799 RepID=A0ABP4EVZ5_9ACTN